MELVCQICMEIFDDKSKGSECGASHFLCDECLNPYLSQNVFPNIFKLKRNKGAIDCPLLECEHTYDNVLLFCKMQDPQKIRYRNIIEDICGSIPEVLQLKSTIQDMLTLKCPNCHKPVDPFPDACSAITCLYCGKWYCNYCFESFASEDAADNSSKAHTHVASHAENRDVFLSPELVAEGQREVQRRMVTKAIVLSKTSADSSNMDSRALTALGLIMAAPDLTDVNLKVQDVWNDALCLEDKASVSSPSSLPAYTLDMDGGKVLAEAMKTFNFAACRQALQAFKDTMDVNYMDSSGFSILSLGVLYNQKEVVSQLLRRGANPMLINNNERRRTSLHIAIERGMLDAVKLMLELNPSIDINSSVTEESTQLNALHVAASYNQGHIAKFLVSQGANLKAKEMEFGYTPVMMSLVLKHSWASRELIILGSDLTVQGDSGRSPLFVLAEKGQIDLLSLVLRQGNGGSQVDMNAPVSSTGMRMIHVAALYNQPQVVSFLLTFNKSLVDIDIRDDEKGYTAFGLAVHAKNISACKALLAAGADVNLPSHAGRTPLMDALASLPLLVEDIIAAGGIDLKRRLTLETCDALPLSLAVLHQHRHLLSTLVRLGADVNQAEGHSGATPLYHAVVLEDYLAVEMLLRLGADPNQKTVKGCKALYFAIEKGNTAIIRLLVEEGGVHLSDIVTAQDAGGSALHVAVSINSANATYELLLLGADVHQVDSRGQTPLEVARGNPDSPILHLLSEHQKSSISVDH